MSKTPVHSESNGRSKLKTMATEIVRNRIRTAVCIDDQYEGVYPEKENEFEKELYKKLYETGCRFIHMQSYPFDMTEADLWSKDTDLLILDWKLNQTGDEFVPALKLLEYFLQHSNCSLICIYTDEPQTDNVYNIIQTYFEASEYEDLSRIEDDIKPLLIENDSLLDKAYQIAIENDEQKELTKEIMITVKNSPEIRTQLFGDGRIKTERKEELTKEIVLYSLYQKHQFASTANSGIASLRRILTDSKETTAINIDNRLITVMSKSGSMGRNKVKPEELIDNLAEAVYKDPNQLYHLLHLRYQTCCRNVIEARSAFANIVTNRILKQLLERHDDSRALDRELREHFMEDISSTVFLQANKLEPELEEEIKKETEEADKQELKRFNAFYSQILCPDLYKNGRAIGFGDIFEIVDYKRHERIGVKQFLICVTAHCDCAYSNERAKNRLCYHFTFGERINDDESFKTNPEANKEELTDFIRLPEGECIPIKWNNYLASVYLKEKNIEAGEIKGAVFKEISFGMKYIGTLKEQYAERIANRVYSYANRVGITYLGSLSTQEEADQ